MNLSKGNQKGFTIIEVVLVLAIAGLIFLVVFLALPALQRSQRDTQRRSDVGRVVSAVQTYKSNNNGSVPTIDASFLTTYLASGSSFNDPQSNSAYTATASSYSATATPNSLATNTGVVYTLTNYKCSNGAAGTFASSTGSISVFVKLETGGSYCQYI